MVRNVFRKSGVVLSCAVLLGSCSTNSQTSVSSDSSVVTSVPVLTSVTTSMSESDSAIDVFTPLSDFLLSDDIKSFAAGNLSGDINVSEYADIASDVYFHRCHWNTPKDSAFVSVQISHDLYRETMIYDYSTKYVYFRLYSDDDVLKHTDDAVLAPHESDWYFVDGNFAYCKIPFDCVYVDKTLSDEAYTNCYSDYYSKENADINRAEYLNFEEYNVVHYWCDIVDWQYSHGKNLYDKQSVQGDALFSACPITIDLKRIREIYDNHPCVFRTEYDVSIDKIDSVDVYAYGKKDTGVYVVRKSPYVSECISCPAGLTNVRTLDYVVTAAEFYPYTPIHYDDNVYVGQGHFIPCEYVAGHLDYVSSISIDDSCIEQTGDSSRDFYPISDACKAMSADDLEFSVPIYWDKVIEYYSDEKSLNEFGESGIEHSEPLW